MTESTYRGFDLFNDIEDSELRNRNRAVVLSNMAQDNTKEQRISPKGAALIIGYFTKVPENDRQVVMNKFKESMNNKGYALV